MSELKKKSKKKKKSKTEYISDDNAEDLFGDVFS